VPPERRGHLVRGVAAEAAEAQLQRLAHQAAQYAQSASRPFSGEVVDLGQVAPDGHLAGIVGVHHVRADDLAALVADVPLRVLR
jgi:hypothetical protein